MNRENVVEMIFPKYQMIASEIVYAGNARFDFRTERGFVEIKGCSMLSGNCAIFPDDLHYGVRDI